MALWKNGTVCDEWLRYYGIWGIDPISEMFIHAYNTSYCFSDYVESCLFLFFCFPKSDPRFSEKLQVPSPFVYLCRSNLMSGIALPECLSHAHAHNQLLAQLLPSKCHRSRRYNQHLSSWLLQLRHLKMKECFLLLPSTSLYSDQEIRWKPILVTGFSVLQGDLV